jgi:hypothetical protein
MSQQSVSDVVGPWVESDFHSALIQRCKKFWSVPVCELPNEILATYIRQRIALQLVVPEAQRRLDSGSYDDTEIYDGELADALAELNRGADD